MAKTIRMVLYGEPGVGKSTFAFGAPRPFFITTDPNYEYLEDYFGADPKNHVQVSSWAEAKKVFQTTNYDNYDTIVVDLLEDLYMWSENEFCKDNSLKHISDFGYGKGYGMVGQEFFIEIQKLLNLANKNVILIMHGTATTLKDRRGVEYTKYAPSSIIREKLITQIEGRVRFFVRAFADTTEDEGGRLITKRFLSLSPDGNTEYGIARGLTGDIPRFIPLDWETFYTIATKPSEFMNSSTSSVKVIETENVTVPIPAAPRKPVIKRAATKTEMPVETKEAAPVENKVETLNEKLVKLKEQYNPMAQENPHDEPVEKEVVEEAPVKTVDPVPAPTAPTAAPTNKDKLAEIKAKLAAIQAKKNN